MIIEVVRRPTTIAELKLDLVPFDLHVLRLRGRGLEVSKHPTVTNLVVAQFMTRMYLDALAALRREAPTHLPVEFVCAVDQVWRKRLLSLDDLDAVSNGYQGLFSYLRFLVDMGFVGSTEDVMP